MLLVVALFLIALLLREGGATDANALNSRLGAELVKDCILARGKASTLCAQYTATPEAQFKSLLEECLQQPNDTARYTVHFLLGPLQGVVDVLQPLLPTPPGEPGVEWLVQDRAQWDNSLIELARGRNSWYDGLVLDPAVVPDMIASGALLDLAPFIVADGWNESWRGIASQLRWSLANAGGGGGDGGAMFSVPLGAAAMTLHYRSDVLAAHGLAVPRTWDQLLYAVRTVHGRPGGPNATADAEFYGLCTLPYAECHADAYEFLAVWASFIQAQGTQQGAFFDPASFTPLIGNAGTAAAMRYYRALAAFGPPRSLANATITTNGTSKNASCSSFYGTALQLYSAGRCAFQIAPHPVHKQHTLLAPSAAVRAFSRSSHLPGSTAVLDRDTGALVACSPALCPYAEQVRLWPTDAATQAELLGAAVGYGDGDGDADDDEDGDGDAGGEAAAAALASATAGTASGSAGDGAVRYVLANMAPVLALSPLSVGVNAFTSPLQQAHTLRWVRRVTDPAMLWELVLSPATPLAPFRYEHFIPSNLHRWVAAGYAAEDAADHLALSFDILVHGNVLAFPGALQRFLNYRAALHAAAYNLSASPTMRVEAIMAALQAQLSLSFSPLSPGFPTLRLQYLMSIGRTDLLTAPSPPPPPPPPDRRYGMGRAPERTELYDDFGDAAAARRLTGTAVGATMACLAAAGLVALAAFAYRQLEKKRGWGRAKDPGVGPGTTLVVTDIEASTVLWEDIDARVMDVALSLHHDSVRRVTAKWAGYESVTEGDSFTVAFHTPESAVGFSLEVQSELMEQPWPLEVLQHEACRPVYVISVKRLRHLLAKSAQRAAAQASAAEANALEAGEDGALTSPMRTFSRAARRLDLLSGLSVRVRRSMSFVHRPATQLGITATPPSGTARSGSALASALAGGGSSGGGGGGANSGPGLRGGSGGAGVRILASPAVGAMGPRNGRDLLEHLLPMSGSAPVVRAAPAPSALVCGLRMQSFAAPATAPSPVAASSPRGNRRRLLQTGPFNVVTTDTGDTQTSSGPEADPAMGSGGAVTPASPASPAPGAAALQDAAAAAAPPRIASLLAVAAQAGMLAPPLALSVNSPRGSAAPQCVRTRPEGPSPPTSMLKMVRRTQSTTAPSNLNDNLPHQSRQATTAGSAPLGQLALHEGSASRRASRLADTPVLIPTAAAAAEITTAPLGAGGGGGSGQQPPGGVGEVAIEPERSPPQTQPQPDGHLRYQSASFSAAAMASQRQRPMGLDGTPGQRSRLLRGWRSWTGRSLSVLRKMQRSFRGPRAAANATAAAEGGIGVATSPAALPPPPPIVGVDALRRLASTDAVPLARERERDAEPERERLDRDALAGFPSFEGESRSSSHHSHATTASVRSLATSLQSALLLHSGRRRRAGGRASVDGECPFSSPATYGSELRGKWAELPESLRVDPLSVGAVLAFRGFRVRIGMHSGVRLFAEINRNHPSGRTRYSGPPLLCAKAVSDAAHGGMVVASRHTVTRCSNGFLVGGGVVVWRIGDFVLGSPRLPATLFQLSSPALVLRGALQRPLSRTFMPLGLGVLDAPITRVACAAIRLAAGTALLEHAPPEVGLEATSVFQALAYQHARLGGGYLAQLGAGSAMCVFSDAYRAALWAAQVHAAMFRYPWSEKLLGCEACEPLRFNNAQGQHVVASRGPRVKAVVHWGPACSMLNPLTGQLSYTGPVVEEAMRLLNGLGPSVVVATMEAAASLRRYRPPNGDAARAAAGASGSTASQGASQSQSMYQSQLLPNFRGTASRSGMYAPGDGDGAGGGASSAGGARTSNSLRAARWREALTPSVAGAAALQRSSSATEDTASCVDMSGVSNGRMRAGGGIDEAARRMPSPAIRRKQSSPGMAATGPRPQFSHRRASGPEYATSGAGLQAAGGGRSGGGAASTSAAGGALRASTANTAPVVPRNSGLEGWSGGGRGNGVKLQAVLKAGGASTAFTSGAGERVSNSSAGGGVGTVSMISTASIGSGQSGISGAAGTISGPSGGVSGGGNKRSSPRLITLLGSLPAFRAAPPDKGGAPPAAPLVQARAPSGGEKRRSSILASGHSGSTAVERRDAAPEPDTLVEAPSLRPLPDPASPLLPVPPPVPAPPPLRLPPAAPPPPASPAAPGRRVLRTQQSARSAASPVAGGDGSATDDNGGVRSVAAMRVHQSFTYGQRAGPMVRPRLQDLMAVSLYGPAEEEDEAEAGAVSASSATTGGKRNGGSGGSSGKAAGGFRRQGVASPSVGGPSDAQPDSASASSLWGLRGGAGGGGGGGPAGSGNEPAAGTMEALIRGHHGRISRSFTFTAHRRSPLAISSYAGDPVVGATGAGAGGVSVSGTVRQASGLSRVLYGAVITAGAGPRDAAAASGARPAGAAPTAAGPGGAAVAAPSAPSSAVNSSAAAAADGSRADAATAPASSLHRTGSASGITATHSPRIPRRGASFSPTSGVPRPPASRARRGSQEPGPLSSYSSLQQALLTGGATGNPSPRASPRASSGAGGHSPSGPASPSRLGSTPFNTAAAATFEFPRSSNSAGTLIASQTSQQLRISAADFMGSITDAGGSTDTSGPATGGGGGGGGSGSGSRHRDTAAVAAAGKAPSPMLPGLSAPSAATLDSGPGGVSGSLASLFSRVRMGLTRSRSRSRSHTRNFVVAADESAHGPAPQPAPELMLTSGDVATAASSASLVQSLQPAAPAAGTAGGGGGTSGGGPGVAGAASSGGGSGAAKVMRSGPGGEKLPTLPESGLAPMIRELVHLQLRLLPMRVNTRAAGRSVVGLAGGGVLSERAEEQQQPGNDRSAVFVHVYRVVLLEGASQGQDALLQRVPSIPKQRPPRVPSRAATTPGLLLMSADLHESPRQGPRQGRDGQGGSEGEGVGPELSLHSFHTTITNLVATLPDSDRGPSQGQDLGLQTVRGSSHQAQDKSQLPDIVPSPRRAAPVMPRPAEHRAAEDLRPAEADPDPESSLVTQFLNCFADLADPALAHLWVSDWQMSLMQDRPPPDVTKVRAMLVAQEKDEEVFERDGFLFGGV